MSNLAVLEFDDSWRDVTGDSKKALWIPHRRTGIYYPEGSEWVLDDVFDQASTKEPFWFRSETADKPDPNDYSRYGSLHTNV